MSVAKCETGWGGVETKRGGATSTFLHPTPLAKTSDSPPPGEGEETQMYSVATGARGDGSRLGGRDDKSGCLKCESERSNALILRRRASAVSKDGRTSSPHLEPMVRDARRRAPHHEAPRSVPIVR
jgi:hypothetical protein